MHLAEFNQSIWKVSPRSEIAKGFIDNIDKVNAIAERSPGFVWRMRDEGRDENGRMPFGGPMVLVTCSVWETPEHLEHFVWNTVHKQIYNRKADWFRTLERHHMVFWWVEEGHKPTLQEAKARMDHLTEHGNSDFAFDWSHLPQTTKWREERV